MSVFFQENAQRKQRVEQLVTECIMIQDEMKRVDKKWKEHDKRAYAYLERVAKAAGYSTPQDYIDAALRRLPQKQADAWRKKRDQALKLGNDMKLAFDVSGGVFAVSMLGRLAATEKALALFGIVTRYTGLRFLASMVAQGTKALGPLAQGFANFIAECFEATAAEIQAAREAGLVGDLAAETKLFTEAAEAGIVLEKGAGGAAEALAEGSEVAAKGATTIGRGLRYVRIACNALSVAAALITVGVLIFDYIHGKRQCEELRRLTLEYQAKRFIIKQGSMRLDQAFTNLMDMTKLIVKEDAYNEMIAEGDMTEKRKEEKMKKEVEKAVQKYKESFTIIEDKTIMEELKKLDEKAWTKEDHYLSDIKQWLKDHPAPKKADEIEEEEKKAPADDSAE